MKKCKLLSSLFILSTSLSLTGCSFISSIIEETNTNGTLKYQDNKKDNYVVGDVFDSFIDNGGLSVYFVDKNSTENHIDKSEFTYSLFTPEGKSFSGTKAFETSGTYKVNISHEKAEAISYNISVRNIEATSVVLSKHSLDLNLNDTATLSVSILPSSISKDYVTWYTSNSSVVTIDNGLVKAVGYGTGVITAKVGSKLDTCTVNVKKPVNLVSITATNYTSTCYVGDTYTFDGKVIANYSDGSTADVTSSASIGSISTYLAGNKTLTISYNGVSTTITITVNEQPAATLVSISASGYTDWCFKGDTYTFDGVVTATYSDKTTSIVTSSCTYSTIYTTLVGYKTLTITYKTVKTTITIEVKSKPTTVTGVTLPSTREVKVGSSVTLTPTISPSNATNKNVTWSSSKPAVASVSSGVVKGLTEGTTDITVKTEDGGFTAKCTVTVTAKGKNAWTVMIYMCGSDLEDENSLATSDLKEILSVNNQPDDVNIIVETGGSYSWSLSSSYLSGATSIDASKLSRWHVENKKLVLDNTLTYASMGSSSTFQSFLQWGLTEYPADKTGVILWNHGGGMFGCCYDQRKNDDSLTNSETKTALTNAFNATSTSKLEFIGYDCCLMQVQDIAEFNSNYFNYMIGSEESEVGEGWDYNTWIDDLYAKKETTTILKAIVDGFISDNGGASSSFSDQTLSYLDLSYMSEYKTAFESFATAMSTQLKSKSVSYSTFAAWMSTSVKQFAVDSDDSQEYYCLFDVKDMITKIASHSTYNPGSTYTNAVLNAFSNLVAYSVAQKGAGKAYGLACVYVQSNYGSYYMGSSYTTSTTNFTNWRNFLLSYSYL